MIIKKFHLGTSLRISDKIDKPYMVILAKELVSILGYSLKVAPWGSVEHVGDKEYLIAFHDCFVWLEFQNRDDTENFIKQYEEIFDIRCGDHN